MSSKADYVVSCVTMLCCALRMEAVNPNESFVSFLYAKPHPKCMYNTVRTHTFPPALICDMTEQRTARSEQSVLVGRLVGLFPGMTQADSNVLTAITYSRNNFWLCTFVATHRKKQNSAPLFHNIMCVYLTDCLHSIQHYQSDLPGLFASSPAVTNVGI